MYFCTNYFLFVYTERFMKAKTKILISIVMLLIIAAGGLTYLSKTVLLPYCYDDTRFFIHADDDAATVQEAMVNSLGKEYGNILYKLWDYQGGTSQRSHGLYQIRRGERAYMAARRIVAGRQDPIRITLVSIRSRQDFADRLSKFMEFSADEFLKQADSVIANNGFTPEQLTAAVLPDTYEFYWTASPAKTMEKLLATRQSFWNDDRRAKAETLGLSPEQVHTLASIVYSESKKSDEWGDIARLYLNRLNKEMPLQADPTVVFASGEFGVKRVEARHIAVESPYNTYKYRGLPPGPIYMVERNVIDSVLTAPKRPWLYMCAKSDFSGYHDFTNSYNTHRINAARYHRALKARGL